MITMARPERRTSRIGQAYSTSFAGTENPLSEGGRWLNGLAVGLDWADASKTPGRAIGHQLATVAFTDTTAILTGTWAADQSVSITAFVDSWIENAYQELEARLRSTMTAHSCTGYECFRKISNTGAAYLSFVRWNGPVANATNSNNGFTELSQVFGAQYGLQDGDTHTATIVGNIITAYKNGVADGTCDITAGAGADLVFTSGNPGFGINLGNGDGTGAGTNANYGITSFSAVDL